MFQEILFWQVKVINNCFGRGNKPSSICSSSISPKVMTCVKLEVGYKPNNLIWTARNDHVFQGLFITWGLASRLVEFLKGNMGAFSNDITLIGVKAKIIWWLLTLELRITFLSSFHPTLAGFPRLVPHKKVHILVWSVLYCLVHGCLWSYLWAREKRRQLTLHSLDFTIIMEMFYKQGMD
mgnify:CR=1 FL=1